MRHPIMARPAGTSGSGKAPHAGAQQDPLKTSFLRLDEDSFAGHVVDEADLSRRFVVELILDGHPARLARADAYVHDLARTGVGDGCYGFCFTLPRAVLDHARVVEARLANSGAAVGTAIMLAAPSPAAPERLDPLGAGAVHWLGGLRFQGWCPSERAEIPTITAIIEGETVAQAQATQWAHVGSPENARAMRSFDLFLPERFADGRLRRVRFVRENGEDIAASPVAFVHFADGLEAALARLGRFESERLRGKLFDRMLPAALPFAQYPQWRARFPIAVADGTGAGAAVILVGDGDERASVASIKKQRYPDWVVAALPALSEQTAFDPADLREFLAADGAQCEFAVFALAGTRFADKALARLDNCLRAHPEAIAAFADFELEDQAGAPWPVALSAFDYERMLEQGQGALLFALRREAAQRAVAAGSGDLFRLFNVALDRDRAAQRIIHLPGALATLPPLDLASGTRVLAAASAAHLAARGMRASVAPGNGSLLPAARLARASARASVTIVIPVRNRAALLKSCLASLKPAVAASRAEILIIDNDSSEPDMLAYLDALDGRSALVMRAPGPFNFARLNNIAAEKADSEHLLLLNNDIKAIDRDWLREMLSRIAEPDVGAVGALLMWPSGVVQHAGVVLGANFGAVHACNERIERDGGYADLMRVAHEASAVTAACLLTRRRDYLAVGGMDELRFPVNFNDVDYCLKLRAAGKRIVLTPHARLLHLESASRRIDAERTPRFECELRALRARWGECLIDDPYYNPMLSLDGVPFSALAWPPRDMRPRAQAAKPPAEIPPGF
jgi:GT2 family glycosyltransferase